MLNKEIVEVVLDNASQKAKYTSPVIQQEILKIIVGSVRNKILDEFGDAKYCILVDESVNEFNKKHMAIILRHVDGVGFVRE